MHSIGTLIDGMKRVNRAPAILVGVWAMTVLVSLPLGLALRGMLEQHLGSSLAADTAASGVNFDWWQEFSDQATGLGTTFRPTIVGFGAVLDNLSAFLDNERRPIVIAGAASAYVVLWIFVTGGILDRYARNRATRAHGFFAASGVFFFRFLRLAALIWLVYALLFGYVHRWLFAEFGSRPGLYRWLTRETTVERSAFFTRAALYVLFAAMVGLCNLVFDYAKVRAVVEDRRSMVGAVRAAIGFVRRNAAAAAALYIADIILFGLIVAAYALVAPGAGSSGWSMWLGFGLGQLYVLARLWVKLVFWASETALFQARLAHAGYVARPLPAWPESPAAEALKAG